MRLSTATTPRVISCAEDHPEHIALPRGCRDDLSNLLAGYDIPLAIEDKRNEGEPVEFRFQGRLTGMQEEAVKVLLSHDDGVFVAPPGTGKTVVGAYLTAARGRNTLVLVHRKPILDQWVARLSSFLGVDPKTIGRNGESRISVRAYKRCASDRARSFRAFASGRVTVIVSRPSSPVSRQSERRERR